MEDISLRDGMSAPRVPGVRVEPEVTLWNERVAVMGAGIDDDSTAATDGTLSEREREGRLTLVFAGRPAGEGDSDGPLYIESGGGLLTSPEALVEPFDIRIKFPSGSKS